MHRLSVFSSAATNGPTEPLDLATSNRYVSGSWLSPGSTIDVFNAGCNRMIELAMPVTR